MKKEKINKFAGFSLSAKERVAYYSGDIGRLIGMAIVASYMTTFLAFQGLSMTSLAAFILIVKIVDAVDDVVFGFFVDKLKITEWKLLKRIVGKGKYLPWFRLTFAFCPIATILFFLMPSGAPDAVKIAWFTITYIIYDFSCTLIEVPMNSLVLTLTDNVDERNHILKMRGIITVLGGVFAGLALSVLISEGVGVPISVAAIIISAICLVAMIPLAKVGKEYNVELKNTENEKEEKYTLRQMWNCIKTNKYMTIVLISELIVCCTATAGAVQNLVSFYLLNNSLFLSIPVLLAFIPAMILSGFADKIAKKFGRKNSFVACSIIAGAMFLIMFFTGYENTWLVILLHTIYAIPNTIRSIFSGFIAPDTIEYARYKTGTDCSGIFFAMKSFITKATYSIGGSLGLFLMGLFGWVEVNATDFADLAAQNVAQPESALNGMWFVYTLIPALGTIAGAVVMMFYNLKEKDVELMAQCNAGKITREECEAQLSRKY